MSDETPAVAPRGSDVLAAIGNACCGRGRLGEDDSANRERLRQVAWKLRRDYRRASGGRNLGELWPVIAGAVGSGRAALLAWFDLIEEIVQLTELRFGSAAGNGAFKAGQAKAAIRRLLHQSPGRSEELVRLLGPTGVDLITGVVMDAVVAMLNEDPTTLWVAGEEGRAPRLPFRVRFAAWLVRLVAVPLSWFETRPVLDPTLYDEVERIVQANGSPLVVLDQLLDVGNWVVDNRQQTIAIVNLISTACDEVEYFTTIEGSAAKQRYARDLIIVTLEEVGIVLEGAWLWFAEILIDVVIDLVVMINHKRGRYRHRTR